MYFCGGFSGNLLTDAMVEHHIANRESDEQWAMSSIAVLTGGSIRASVQPGESPYAYQYTNSLLVKYKMRLKKTVLANTRMNHNL